MYLKDVATSVSRRWYLAIVGLLGTAGLCFLTLAVVPPTYQAQASVFLLPPANIVDNGGNPYLQLANLDRVIDVVTRSLSSQSTVEALAVQVPGGEYEAARDFTSSGPIILVTATAKSPEASLATVKAVTDLIPPTLKSLQDAVAVADRSQITSSVLTTDGHPEIVRKTQTRALIAVAAVGLLGSAMIIGAIDSFLLRRRHRAAIAEESSAETGEARTVLKMPEGTQLQPQSSYGGRRRRSGLHKQLPHGDDEQEEPGRPRLSK